MRMDLGRDADGLSVLICPCFLLHGQRLARTHCLYLIIGQGEGVMVRNLGKTHHRIRKRMTATALFKLVNVEYRLFVKLAWFGNRRM